MIEEHTTSYLNINSSAAHELRFSKICIIDEAILMSFKLLELLDRFFRDVTRNTNIPFGGMLMLLAGDFMQCLAIKDEDDCDMNESGEYHHQTIIPMAILCSIHFKRKHARFT